MNYDFYKISSWNHPQQFRDSLCLVCLVIIQCIYILCRWLDIQYLGNIQSLLCSYIASILWHLCFFVVRFYNTRHVSRAIITNIYSDCVENCMKFIRFWKVLIFQIQKSFSYVGGENFVKRWIEPNDDTAGISFLFYVLLICIN